MEPEEKQQLSQVKELIQQKRFDDARLILQSMPFNETAQKWLEKLDQVTVQQRAAIPGTNEPSQVKDPFKPLNPSMYFGVRLFFIAGMVLGPLAVGFFALNWKRLGKPEWSLETFLLGVFLGVGAVASLALMLAGVVDETVGLIAALLFALGNAVLTMFLADVQKSAYDTWKIGGRQALMQHDYQISRKFMLSGGLFLALIALAGVTMFFASQKETFENEMVIVKYPQNWVVYAPDWSTACRETPERGCFLTLAVEAATNFTSSALVFEAEAVENAPSTVDPLVQEYIDWPSYTFIGVEEMTISGRPASVVDFTTASDEPSEPPYYQTVFITASDTHLIIVRGWTQDEATHQRRREEFVELLGEMVIK